MSKFLIMFFKVFHNFLPNIKLEVWKNSGRPGWKTGSSLAFFVLLYGHFTIFHSLNMIEVGSWSTEVWCFGVSFGVFFLRRGLIINFWEANKKKSAKFRGDFFPASRKLAKSFLLKAPRLLQQVNRIWWRLFEMSVFWPGWSNSQMMTTHCQRFRSSFNVVCCRVFLRGVCDVFHSIFGIGCRLVGTSYQQARKLVIAHNKLDINTCMFIQFVLLNV